jgi:aminomethyltransferase
MAERTPLYAEHVAAGARLVEFGGWDMPVQYASAINEHHAVRRAWGVFDVSHMTVVDAQGPDVRAWLRQLLANDIDRLREPGRGLYSCMLNEAGGVVDDLIVYWRGGDRFRLVVNAATRDKDLAWLARVAAGRQVTLAHQAGAVMLAVQGPAARTALAPLLPPTLGAAVADLRSFASVEADGLFVARTGYTGEDGVELITDATRGVALWRALLAAGATPCGLGARDTLRLEAALNLYGQDMDETTSPLVFEPRRDFIGRGPLEMQRAAGPRETFTGLLLEERGIVRHGMRVRTSGGDGIVTSGGYSPTLERSIALVRVPVAAEPAVTVDIRGSWRAARLVRTPFVRQGRSLLADVPAAAS